jgi:Ca2+-binding EF-hand superfamily protein
VSVRELQQGLEVIGIELSKSELKCVVQQFEVDNGRVSYEKLVQYITETIISASPTRYVLLVI